MRYEETKILQVKEIDKTYAGGNHAVKQVSFDIYKGECMGLVGESGSGKSTLARCLLTLERIDSGEIWLNEQPLHQMKPSELRQARQKMQVVFQNPTASFNSKISFETDVFSTCITALAESGTAAPVKIFTASPGFNSNR